MNVSLSAKWFSSYFCQQLLLLFPFTITKSVAMKVIGVIQPLITNKMTRTFFIFRSKKSCSSGRSSSFHKTVTVQWVWFLSLAEKKFIIFLHLWTNLVSKGFLIEQRHFLSFFWRHQQVASWMGNYDVKNNIAMI